VIKDASAPPARNLLYSKALFIILYNGVSALFIESEKDLNILSTPSIIFT
jgi:hypothetical protein